MSNNYPVDCPHFLINTEKKCQECNYEQLGVKILICSKVKVGYYKMLVSTALQHSSKLIGKSRACVSHVIVFVSSLILNKNFQKLLLSQAPSRHQSQISHSHFLHKCHGNSPAFPGSLGISQHILDLLL